MRLLRQRVYDVLPLKRPGLTRVEILAALDAGGGPTTKRGLEPALGALREGGSLHTDGDNPARYWRGLPLDVSTRAEQADWGDEMLAELDRLWGEGHSTAEIGRRLHVSKNAVVGKSKRMGLERRASPIILSSAEHKTRVARVYGSTLPPLRSEIVTPEIVPMAKPARKIEVARPSVVVGSCQWPLNDGRPWKFCEAPVFVFGKPYCAKHSRDAYVKRFVPDPAAPEIGNSFNFRNKEI